MAPKRIEHFVGDKQWRVIALLRVGRAWLMHGILQARGQLAVKDARHAWFFHA